GRIEARVQQLNRIKSALVGRAAFDEEIRKCQAEIERLEQVVQRQRSSIDLDDAGELLQQGMNEYLKRLSVLNPNSWTQDAIVVRLAERNLSFKVGGRIWKRKLGGTLTLYFLMAYHYALMK